MTRFVSLSSGSNGNCYYIGNESFGILIDAGIGTRTIKKRLAERGLSVDSVRCVLVSHDHFDHIRSLGTFAERFQRPVYATAPCIAAFRRHYCTKGYLDGGRCRPLLPGAWLRLDDGCDRVMGGLFDGDFGGGAEWDARGNAAGGTGDAGSSVLRKDGSEARTYAVPSGAEAALGQRSPRSASAPSGSGIPGREGVWVLPFSVPHDATDTVGFHIRFFGETFTFLTDVGDVTEDAVRYASMARHLIVEANYDPEMLRTGPYPPDLQARIRNGHGHLSNGQTAELIRRALAGDLLQDIFLCHLSENNNTPELALAAVSAVLPQPLPASDAPGIRLVALPRREASELFTW